MKQKLIIIFSYLLFAFRWTGLTSYSINFTNENFTFKRTKFAKSINIVLVVIIMLTCLTSKHCYSEEDEVDSVSSSISTILFVNCIVALVSSMNLKQTHIIKTFCKIIVFQQMVEKLTNEEIHFSKISKVLKYYASARYLIPLLHFVINSMLGVFVGTSFVICITRFLSLSIVLITGEVLIFYYLTIIVTAIEQLNNFSRNTRFVHTKELRKVFQMYSGLKKDLQIISQMTFLFKFVYIKTELAVTFYQLWTKEQNNYFSVQLKICYCIAITYWVLTLLLETFLLLYPYIRYYRKVQ
jgi:hypothetical protein